MRKEERRAQILRHAKSVFARRGYHDAAIADIIGSAGVARGTFYLHFTSKRDVFGTILDELLRELDEAVRPVDLGPGRADPIEQVRSNVRRVLDIVGRDPETMKLLFHQATALDRQSRTALRRFFEHVRDMIERSLKHGIRLGILRAIDTRIVSSCILGTIREIVEELMAGKRFDLGRLEDEVVRFGLKGILR